MTKEEAIKLLHRDTTRGAVAKLEYYAGFNGEKVIEQIQEAMDMGAEALERQIPKKPVFNSGSIHFCPTCVDENKTVSYEFLLDRGQAYCQCCGQAIAWEE